MSSTDSQARRALDTASQARPRLRIGGPLDDRLRIGIIGPGAMGCLFGALLARAGHEVWLLCRQESQAELLEQRGVLIERDPSVVHSSPRQVPAAEWIAVRATADARAAATLDLLLVLVKSHATRSAASAALPALGPITWVLTLQNGLGNVEALAEVLGRERLLAGACSHGATLLGPGHVRHAGVGPTALTDFLGGKSDRAHWAAELLTAAGFRTEAAADLAPMLWSKLVANTAINALTALTGRRNGEVPESPLGSLFDDLANETASVAAAIGVELPFDDAAAHARKVAELTAANRSSMLQDIEQGRPTEIGALNEAVAAEGARLGVPTPLNRAVAALVRDLEARQSERLAAERALG